MKHSRITVYLSIILFGVFTVGSLLSPQTVFSPKENRFLQTKPQFTLHSLMNRTFGTDYERYLSDQFPLRDYWITLHAQLEQKIGKTEINHVYIGNENYFMEAFSASVFESEQAKKNIRALKKFTDYLRTQLLSTSVMIVPTSSEILNEKLPPFASPYPQHNFLETIEQQIGLDQSVSIACMQTLHSHSKEPIYYRTDHHWTSLGAFYAYETWISKLGFSPYPKDAFEIQTIASDFYGTIDAKLPLSKQADSMEFYQNKFLSFQAVYNQNSADTRTSLLDKQFLSKRDKYRCYLGGNYGLIEIKTQIPDRSVNTNLQNNPVYHLFSTQSNDRRLLILKDSYANCFVPIAAGHFSYTAVIDPRFFSGHLLDFIQQNAITDVLILYSTSGFAQDQSFSGLISSSFSKSLIESPHK